MTAKQGSVEQVVFDDFPYGIIATSRHGELVRWNDAAAALLGDHGHELLDSASRCCDVLGCRDPGAPLGGVCMTEAAFDRDAPMPEIRVDLAGVTNRAAWVTVARSKSDTELAIIELRPGQPGDRRRRTDPHWSAGPQLYIRTFGRTRVESAEGTLSGAWLEQRSGQVLKYLVCERHRVVHTDEVAEAIWPNSKLAIGGTVRHFIHGLRDRLEPEREKRGQSSFVVSAQGGYELDRGRVKVDADEFETLVRSGLRAAERGATEDAAHQLHQGLEIYTGDFLADEPYAEWVQEERGRLRELAGAALLALSEIEAEKGHMAEAIALRARLADLRPFDPDVQRDYVQMLIDDGRRTEALHRYSRYADRLQREFGDEPEFELSDLRRAR
jgi:DNA-binding SARP family transcriptional activator